MISISDYIARLSQANVASPNHYWVEMSLPRGIDDSNNKTVSEMVRVSNISRENTRLNQGPQLSMRCINAQLPGRSIMTVENRHYSSPHRLPYAINYEPISMTFMGSNPLNERIFFELWQETVANVRVNSMNFYDEYVADMKIYQLDRMHRRTYGVQLVQVYPLNVSPIEYSYQTTNDIVSVQVTLNYRRWYNLNIENRSVTQ